MDNPKDSAQAALKDLPIKVGQHYRHFKGGEYEIVAIAVKEDTLEALVVYHSLSKQYVWARTYQNFTEEIDRPEYSYKGPRFVLMMQD